MEQLALLAPCIAAGAPLMETLPEPLETAPPWLIASPARAAFCIDFP